MDDILNIALIGAVAVGGIYVLKQLTGANLAKEAGTATGEAVGGAAGGFVGGVTTGAIDAGKDLGKYLGFYDGWLYDFKQNLGINEQQLLGTRGTFPNGEVFYIKNGVQTPSDEDFLTRHPEYRRNNSPSNSNTNNSGGSISVGQTPVSQRTIDALVGSASVGGVAVQKQFNNFATNSSGEIIGNLSGYATLAEARAYEQSAGRNSSVSSVGSSSSSSSSGKSPSGIPLSTDSYKIVGGKLVKN